ncbi:MAG: 30S ribosomal protein S6e [Candidatus Asgardarchaeum sp.]|nr:30S ribosomal protein S6e [Candidatus Odinarchaeota archaeon]
MPEFKVVISDPKTGKSRQIEVKDEKARALIDKKIGDIIDGELIGVSGVKLQITGGSDIAGFPMRADIEGPIKKYILLSGGVGFRPRRKGERRRKLVRGNTISEDIVQINMKIIYPEKPKRVKKKKVEEEKEKTEIVEKEQSVKEATTPEQ